jgi:hypothetical protein
MDGVERFLRDYPAALVAGDVERAASFWGTPCLVVRGAQRVVVTDPAQVRGFLEAGRGGAQGAALLRARRHEAREAGGVVLLEVEWERLGPGGEALGGSRWTYALDLSGDPVIVAAFA